MKVGEINFYLYNPGYRWSKKYSMVSGETKKIDNRQRAIDKAFVGNCLLPITH
jgi:hypothetical protein